MNLFCRRKIYRPVPAAQFAATSPYLVPATIRYVPFLPQKFTTQPKRPSSRLRSCFCHLKLHTFSVTTGCSSNSRPTANPNINNSLRRQSQSHFCFHTSGRILRNNSPRILIIRDLLNTHSTDSSTPFSKLEGDVNLDRILLIYD